MFTSPYYPTLKVACCQKAANEARSPFLSLALVPRTLLKPPGKKPLCPHRTSTMLRAAVGNIN